MFNLENISMLHSWKRSRSICIGLSIQVKSIQSDVENPQFNATNFNLASPFLTVRTFPIIFKCHTDFRFNVWFKLSFKKMFASGTINQSSLFLMSTDLWMNTFISTYKNRIKWSCFYVEKLLVFKEKKNINFLHIWKQINWLNETIQLRFNMGLTRFQIVNLFW